MSRRTSGTRIAWDAVRPLTVVLWALAGCHAEDARTLELSPELESRANTACEGPVDCPADRANCVSGLCVQCVEDEQCDSKNPACYRGSCVQCTRDEHCEADHSCNVPRRSCALNCVEEADCADQRELRCNGTHCVQCTDDEHCDSKHPICSASRGSCVECATDTDCGDRVCDLSSERCVDCDPMNDDCAEPAPR